MSRDTLVHPEVETSPHESPSDVNLTERFGDRYRVEWEPGSNTRDPWYMQIPCNGGRGHICPWGPKELAACTNTRSMTNRLARLPYTRVHQDGNDGGNVVFPVEHFEEVARIMHARRRKQLSEEHRAKLVEAGRRFQISPGCTTPKNRSVCVPTATPVWIGRLEPETAILEPWERIDGETTKTTATERRHFHQVPRLWRDPAGGAAGMVPREPGTVCCLRRDA